MRIAPKLTEIPRYPVVAGTALLAIGVTLAWWSKVDISPLFETAMIRRGELWRLVTSILPHGGILHLVFNIYWLWIFGTLIEEQFGHLKTAALILLFAVGPNALEFGFSSGGIGLSGVGYGLFGLLWILSQRDQRFSDAIDRRTIEIFVAWFFICILTTVTGLMPVANIAHGTGAALGVLTGFAIARPDGRAMIAIGIATILLFGLWTSTLGRPLVNLSGKAGYEEAEWGYEALIANRNQEAARWFRDAVAYQPQVSSYWYNLGIAYEKMDNAPAAVIAYRKAADQGDSKAAFYLASLYATGGKGLSKDGRQALYWYSRAAVEDNADALNSVAWAYATSKDPSIHNPSAALEYARKAVSLGKDHPDPNHLDTLAEAYYINEQHEDAVKTEKQAIALASSEDRAVFQKNLEKYQFALKNHDYLTAHHSLR
jgi:membrane associated rhomboid family serine protease/TPR repeat protein